jgi:hypothetical protein
MSLLLLAVPRYASINVFGLVVSGIAASNEYFSSGDIEGLV